jgi:hypothetical protein
VGTYADPITYAGVKDVTPPGTIIYNFDLQKYFIMEDECEECGNNWKKDHKWHVDLWMGCDEVPLCSPHSNLRVALLSVFCVDQPCDQRHCFPGYAWSEFGCLRKRPHKEVSSSMLIACALAGGTY